MRMVTELSENANERTHLNGLRCRISISQLVTQPASFALALARGRALAFYVHNYILSRVRVRARVNTFSSTHKLSAAMYFIFSSLHFFIHCRSMIVQSA